MAKKWTKEQDDLILKFAKVHENNIRYGFSLLSKLINRTESSIVTRFYCKLNKINAKMQTL